MPAFDLKFISTPEDLPGCLVSVDARVSRGDVSVDGSGNVITILNRSPASLRKKQVGDVLRSKWWDATTEIAVGYPTVDPAAFAGAGGVVVPAGANFIMTSLVQFPAEVAVEFTCMFVVDYTPAAAASVFEDGAGLVVSLDNGAGNLAWSDAGAGAVGPACTSGPQQHLVLFGKATLIAAPTGDWRRNCVPLFSAAYTPTNFGGSNTRIFGHAAHDLLGTAGRMLFYDRRITASEANFLEAVVPPKFGLLPTGRFYVAPTTPAWADPAGPDPGEVSRTNAVSGISERYYRIHRIAGQPVSVLLVATNPATGAVDPSVDFVAWFVEWPFQGSAPEPVVAQDGVAPGVCRLDLTTDGHHLFELWRPGGGAVLVHFDVTAL